MTRLDDLSALPVVTNADPNSRAAAASMEGVPAGTQREAVLRVIEERAPIATWEIEALLHGLHQSVSAAVWTLHRNGYIQRVGHNLTPSGRAAWTYEPTPTAGTPRASADATDDTQHVTPADPPARSVPEDSGSSGAVAPSVSASPLREQPWECVVDRSPPASVPVLLLGGMAEAKCGVCKKRTLFRRRATR